VSSSFSLISHRSRAYLLIVCAIFLWSVGIIVGRGVHTQIPPVGLSFWRWFLAAMVLLPFAYKQLQRERAVVRTHLSTFVLLGSLLVGAGTLLLIGLNYTTAINTALINGAQPALTVLMSWVLIRDRLSRLETLGVFAALVGVVTMVTRAEFQEITALEFNIGDLLIISAVVCYAGYAVNLRKLPKELGLIPALCIILLIGSLLVAPFYILETLMIRSVPLTGLTVGSVVILALFVSIFAMLMWNYGNRTIGHNQAAIFVNLLPVFGSLMAIIFLDESLYAYHFVGAGFVCLGIFLVVRKS